MRRVLIAYKSLPAYRLEFFQQLRTDLAADGIELTIVYGQAIGAEAQKSDTAQLESAIFRRNYSLSVLGRPIIWQAIEKPLLASDLLIVEQASKLLLNYRILLRQAAGQSPVAFWGHGENMQRHSASRISEAVKRRVSTLPRWWFAYTEGSKERVCNLGYPSSRVTVVQNAIDTGGLQRGIAALTNADLEQFYRQFGLRVGRTALYIGSLYAEKRLEFLLSAAEMISAQLPGFRLLIGGDGPMRGLVERAAESTPAIVYLGRVDGLSRLKALAASDITLMPGLVGLAVLDAFAGRAPIVTTDIDYHSPEIEYVRSGVNGVVLPAMATVGDYATAVVDLMTNESRLSRLQEGCAAAAIEYTTEEMVRRFSGGVRQALASVRV